MVKALRERLPNGAVSVVSQDDYYHPKEMQALDPQGHVNFDLPTAVDLDALANDLGDLVLGASVRRQEYTFNQEGREARTVHVEPAPVVLVEGLFVLHHRPIRDLLDLKVFIEADTETQLQRRLRRDEFERGYGRDEVLYQWHNHVMPAYRNYLEPHRHACDMHVINEAGFDRALDVIVDHLARVAERVAPLSLHSL